MFFSFFARPIEGNRPGMNAAHESASVAVTAHDFGHSG
jgi:hypothetical protein